MCYSIQFSISAKTTLPIYLEDLLGPGQFEFLFDTDGDFENYKESTNQFNLDIDYQKNKICEIRYQVAVLELRISITILNGYRGLNNSLS